MKNIKTYYAGCWHDNVNYLKNIQNLLRYHARYAAKRHFEKVTFKNFRNATLAIERV